jgi:hypothetical protein
MLAIEPTELVVAEAEEGGRLPLVVTGGPKGALEGLDLEPGDRLRQRGGECRAT